jgi:t-SNARE complex subunit (syntaxin)
MLCIACDMLVLFDVSRKKKKNKTGRCHQQCNRRKFLCTLTIILLILVIVAVIVTVIVATNKASTGGQ